VQVALKVVGLEYIFTKLQVALKIVGLEYLLRVKLEEKKLKLYWKC